ncbi:hypothetical protein [Azohydromonas caseinilytica]|uniref:Uncharacterized protein n=1 Tax=Azohydromonas caseinilytica TaxID=2728836 RepID=A0A848F8A8_9BURK|nr:hypothetical protein [Azohydromonas caseinilytica]NML15438.1 hypothetical protein [Azohydromonas caseinilytica]
MRNSRPVRNALRIIGLVAVSCSAHAQPLGNSTPAAPSFPDLMAPEKSFAAPSLRNCPCSQQNANILAKRGENATLALESLYRQIEEFSHPTTRSLLWTKQRNLESDELIQESIDAGRDPAPPDGTGPATAAPAVPNSLGFTNGGDCKITISVSSPCLAEILRLHEEVHRRACKKFFDSNYNFTVIDYRAKMRMVDYLNEHVEAYSAEIRAIGEQARYWVATRCTF